MIQAMADQYNEGPSKYGQQSSQNTGNSNPFSGDTNDGFQQAMNARVVENI